MKSNYFRRVAHHILGFYGTPDEIYIFTHAQFFVESLKLTKVQGVAGEDGRWNICNT
jgi:hypothetical protein